MIRSDKKEALDYIINIIEIDNHIVILLIIDGLNLDDKKGTKTIGSFKIIEKA